MSDDAYLVAVRLAKALQSDLEERLNRTLGVPGDRYLVRARLSSPRIKSQPSLERKAKDKGWTLEQAIANAPDFLGFRIICNNLQDVERTAQLVQEVLEKDGLKIRSRNYIQSPLSTGYRAIHLTFKGEVRIDSESGTFGCEIQFRTLLQDTWGHLSHEDIYKGQASGPLSNKMRRLADTLARADRIAEEIRRQVTRPRKGRKPPSGALLTRSSIAFVYHRAFKDYPPEYVVESTLREFGGTPIRADGLDQMLQDKDFCLRLEDAYAQQTRRRWMPGPELLFRWAVYATINGTALALSLASREGHAVVGQFVKISAPVSISFHLQRGSDGRLYLGDFATSFPFPPDDQIPHLPESVKNCLCYMLAGGFAATQLSGLSLPEENKGLDADRTRLSKLTSKSLESFVPHALAVIKEEQQAYQEVVSQCRQKYELLKEENVDEGDQMLLNTGALKAIFMKTMSPIRAPLSATENTAEF